MIFEIYVSHKDVYCYASNISALMVGQYLFTLVIEKDGNTYTLKHERYDLIKETKETINQASITTEDKLTVDVMKYILPREFSAPITWQSDEKRDELIKDLDVVLIYRNDTKGNNETFGFDVRKGMDLSSVLFERNGLGKKQEWIDVGGRSKWRKYPYPAVKFLVEEAQKELAINTEVILICPFQTIPLLRTSDGKYKHGKKISSDALTTLEYTRKTMESSANCKYRFIRHEVYTDQLDYLVSLPFLDKISTVHIFNDTDCRSIQYIEQYVEGSNFKHRKYDLTESFKTEIVKKVGTLKGCNKAIAELNPWLRYKFIVHKGIKNMAYYINPANQHGKINHLDAKNIL